MLSQTIPSPAKALLSNALFAVGVFLGLLGAAKIPQDLHSLDLFVIGVLLAVMGVWRLHQQIRQSSIASDDQSTLNAAQAIDFFKPLPDELDKLEALLHSQPHDTAQTLLAIENLAHHYVIPLVTAQEEMSRRLGRNACADIYICIAQGERLLNRMRSALGDHCPDEARRVFPGMSVALRAAAQYWQIKITADG